MADLIVGDGYSQHQSDNVGTVKNSTLAVSFASHSQTTDDEFPITPADIEHTHSADNVSIVPTVAIGYHAHTLAGTTVLYSPTLIIRAATHSHVVSFVYLEPVDLTVNDGTHGNSLTSASVLSQTVGIGASYCVGGPISPVYEISVYDTSGNLTGIYDEGTTLTYTKILNGVGSYTVTIEGQGDLRQYFGLDYLVQIRREIPGYLDKYLDFEGLHRIVSVDQSKDGRYVFVSNGFSLEELLGRRVIAYLQGTIYADKDINSDTAIKQYVEENCGAIATTTETRLTDGVIPGFTVEASGLYGGTWSGSKAFENLLDVVTDIATSSDIYYAIKTNGAAQYNFYTRYDYLGTDRRAVYSSIPTVFALNLGTTKDMTYTFDRSKEANVVVIAGPGDGATRLTNVRKDLSTIDDSPLNIREVSRDGVNLEFSYQRDDYGDDTLNELKARDTFSFEVLQSNLCLYGRDFVLGDLVTVAWEDLRKDMMISKVSVSLSKSGEKIDIELKDYTVAT